MEWYHCEPLELNELLYPYPCCWYPHESSICLRYRHYTHTYATRYYARGKLHLHTYTHIFAYNIHTYAYTHINTLWVINPICYYTVQCTVYIIQCTVYSVQCILHSVQCCVHCTVYSLQCTLYTVHCTVYSV